MNIMRSSWDSLPSNRPPFEHIACEIKKMCAERLSTFPTAHSPKSALLDQWGALNPYRSHHYPLHNEESAGILGLRWDWTLEDRF
jgi:hypothetical protein